jgi:hypothetical protein
LFTVFGARDGSRRIVIVPRSSVMVAS